MSRNVENEIFSLAYNGQVKEVIGLVNSNPKYLDKTDEVM